MPSGLLNLVLGVAMQVGSPGPSEMPGFPAPMNAYSQPGASAATEPRYRFDTQQTWVHGYFQELPAYGGHPFFRPYNYKDVLSQSQTAAGWGERPGMPYSQQFWHKYHDQATMLKAAQSAPIRNLPVWTPSSSSRPSYAGWSPSPASQVMTVGSQIAIPSSVPISSGQLHMPPQNFTPVGLPEYPQGPGLPEYQQGSELQQAADVVNPVSYGYGYRR